MTAAAPPEAEFITDALAHWAEVKPDAEALAYGGNRWSWAQWYDRVRRVAGALKRAGIGHGDRVAFLDKNNPACLEVSLGAGLLGAVNAVVNWRLAGDELDYVINDSGATVLFAGAELLPAIERIRGELTGVTKVIVVGGENDAYEAFLAAAEPAGKSPGVGPDDLWLVMYSSGTTGRPKGVMLTHRNIVAHTVDVGPVLPFAEGDRNLVAMPLFHVGGTCYALFGIHAGVPSTMTREPDPASLFAAFAAGATHAFLVPAVISGVFAAGEEAVKALAGLKYLVYGAAPMPLPLLRKALAAWPATGFVQVYGQTELAGVISTLTPEAHRDAARPERLESAGTLVPGAELRVVDPATGEDVGTGRAGEFWFRSPQRMLGYLGKPDDTAQAIVADGWLRTGDIGHVDDGGFLYVSDRVKDMIITGGENVYSPEVERVVVEHPAVAEVAVIGVPDEHWGESVKAVIVREEGATATEEEIIAFTRERLAAYKCPRTIDFVPALPRNPSGKILKRTLRSPYWAGRGKQV
ncbi:long-chain-fatty-acid--CoA ligase [Amycolatopsis sp. NPDC059027]|uniref:long-chain-fatty-acid--CoA ligase n=1 Tax=Amycolatopsis sp. NPDC059027 TaxID=3346709 RepID=UPI00366FF919